MCKKNITTLRFKHIEKDGDEKIDPSLFELKYHESAKVTDQCKAQQWQVAILIIGFYFTVTTLYLNKICCNNEVVKMNYWLSWLIFILFLIVLGLGIRILRDLKAKIIEHRCKTKMMNSCIESTGDLEILANRDDKDLQKRIINGNIIDNSDLCWFMSIFIAIILFSAIIAFLIIYL